MTEEEIENEMTRYFKLGTISGIEQAAYKVFGMSVDLFKKNNDDKAKEMKEVFKILLKISKERQEIHDKEYPK